MEGHNSSFNSWIDKKDGLNKEYFSEPKFSGRRKKAESYLSNYVTKVDLKNATPVDTSDFAKKLIQLI